MHLAGFTDAELDLMRAIDSTIVQFTSNGRSFTGFYEEVAAQLKLSPVTVRTRLTRLRSKRRVVREFEKNYRGWQQKFFQKTGGKINPLGFYEDRRGKKQ